MADETRKLNHTASELDAAVDMLLEVYTREEIDGLLAQKVTAVPGSGLITDEEREKLSALENYNDSEVKSQIALNRSTLGYKRKNLLKNTAGSQTINGVTFTVNEDGSVTANGLATGNEIFTIVNIELTVGDKYALNGCPMGGSNTTFSLQGIETTNWGTIIRDYGYGRTFTANYSDNRFRIIIYDGYTAKNLTFYPMLRCAEITDETYEPYKPSVEERLAALEAVIAGGES